MADEDDAQITLQVAGANERDVGKGTARVGTEVLARLGIDAGAVISMKGQRAATAIALPPYPQDQGLDIIRLDGLIRQNAQVGIGDRVEVERAEPQPAQRVVLAPAQPNITLRGSGEALTKTLQGRPLATGDLISTSVYRRAHDMQDGQFPEEIFRQLFQARSFGLQEIRLVVTGTKPRGTVLITAETEIELLPQYQEPGDTSAGPVSGSATYEDIGGLGETIDQVREMIELPLKQPVLFQRLGIDPPKGVLLHGPPGTGKTLIARAVANESEASFYPIAGPEIMGRYYGESEQRLREVFEEAEQNAPSVIFFDEIDSIAPKRQEATGETERRIVAQLLTLMDGLKPRNNVVVIGATNRVDALDEALRRPGRFDREIVIGPPDTAGRAQILSIHTRGMPLADGIEIKELARRTHGFVGADLGALCREAAFEALRRQLPTIDLDHDEIPQECLAKLDVRSIDFECALKRVQPSAMREIMIQAPEVSWDDIGGADEAKRALREGVEMPLRAPEAFERLGIRPAKGFLLYGPPGTGKTLIAKAVAREAEANFVSAKSSDLLSKWYGESEQQVSRLFARARQVAPCVIFIDEIDSLAPARGGSMGEPAVTERVVNTMLAEMDGLEGLNGVVLIGATNRPTLLDPALLRPGRLDELIYVAIPDEAGRRKILGIHTRAMPLAADLDLDRIAERTRGYTGADLENLTRTAGLWALRRDESAAEVGRDAFEAALSSTRPSVTKAMEEEYKKLGEELKREEVSGKRLGFTIARAE